MSVFKGLKTNWLLIAFIALIPLWTVGMFNRGYWTPDEPREAAIAWRMSVQADHTLPQLADQLFLEKPPLSYWISAIAMRLFGDSASAARVPNLIYAAIVALALGLLMQSMAGNIAASVAVIVFGSALTAYQVSIWLAPDACLVAGCAVALFGAYRGYVASGSRDKLLFYTIMHLGAAIGFMAKSAPGWIVPALALLVLMVWEGRLRELLRWELWAGFTLQILGIGLWIASVLNEPNGDEALRVLFWNNLAGRFTDVQAVGALDYAAAHKNWPGKYLIELPYHLFPWTLLVAAALSRAWKGTRTSGLSATPWRFAVASSVPFIILLSLATTARGIYIVPGLLGFAMIVGLWVNELSSLDVSAALKKFDSVAISSTRFCVVFFAGIIFTVLCFMIAADLDNANLWILILSLVCVVLVVVTASRLSALAQRQGRILSSLCWSYVVFAFSVSIGVASLMPIVDQSQDLRPLGAAIKRDTVGHSLGLTTPDETTIAMLDYRLRTPFTVMGLDGRDQVLEVKQWLEEHPNDGRVLVKLEGRATGKLTQLLQRMGVKQKPRTDSFLQALEQAKVAELVTIYERPQGRRYALLRASSNLIAPQ
jgi:4-amino-4-deoxy-L-arabinose transferase-like glycosyltransferase